jgi:SH3 domain-containing YSC84-like protein 1
MRRTLGLFAAIVLLSAVTVNAQDRRKQEERLRDAGQVMAEIINMPDSIPHEVMNDTKCVVVIPGVFKAAFVVGGEYGKGAMVCRTGENYRGHWGAPSMVALEGGSFGFQAGAEATDFVFLITNDKGAHSLLESKVTLGGDVSAAAGPVGRTAAADTDASMRAEILTYSRSRGIFAGAALDGATLHADKDANEALYGRRIPAIQIVRGPEAPPAPQAAARLIALLQKTSPAISTKGE